VKKITLVMAIALVATTITAQNKKSSIFEKSTQSTVQKSTAILYNFQVQTGQTYTEITGGIDINGGQRWDDPDVRIPIPFNCEINGLVNPDSLDFDAGLGSVLGALKYSSPTVGVLLLPMDADLIDRGYMGTTSLSSITYVVQGSAPNRILKVQWKNCGSFDEMDDNSTLLEFVNFQLWLHEGTNIIEYRFGAKSATLTPDYWHFGWPGSLSGLFSLNLNTFDIIDIHLLTGPANAPTMVDSISSMVGTPNNGTVYRFLPTNLSVDDNMLEKTAQIYPNPATEKLYISASLENGSYHIFNITGQTVLRGDFNGTEADISALPIGEYMIRISKGDQSLIQKLIKQ